MKSTKGNKSNSFTESDLQNSLLNVTFKPDNSLTQLPGIELELFTES